MMMMMIMIAGFVDSITTPITCWLDTLLNPHDKTTNMTVKEVTVDGSGVECIVCLSEVGWGERLGMLERCRHGFHVECVEAWLKEHPSCPLCRTPVSGVDHKQVVWLKKLFDIMTCFGIRALESMSSWLTNSFSQGLQSSLSQSCSYL